MTYQTLTFEEKPTFKERVPIYLNPKAMTKLFFEDPTLRSIYDHIAYHHYNGEPSEVEKHLKELHTIYTAAKYRTILPVKALINNIIKRPAKTLLEKLHSVKLINKEKIKDKKVYTLLKENLDVICRMLFTLEAIELGSKKGFNLRQQLGLMNHYIELESDW